MSLATATNWFWNMVLAFGVPPLLWNISYKMYYIFGAFNAAAFVHMSLLAPETKGYTLEEMDEVFDSGQPAWKKHKKRSRLEELEREIEAGNIKVRDYTKRARQFRVVCCFLTSYQVVARHAGSADETPAPLAAGSENKTATTPAVGV